MQRSANLERLGEPFDLVVIGGGASGLGCAVEAATRGYRVALIEAHDFAKGTSSRSTKLVHGGVRYLAQGNFGLVRDALRERGRLRRNAPHLVGDLEFVVPAYSWWNGPYYGVGLKLYDVLAGKHRLGASELISRAEVLERIPSLEQDGLRGGIVYHDGQFDDARLAMALAWTAADHGAVLVNHAPVVRLLHENGREVPSEKAHKSQKSASAKASSKPSSKSASMPANETRRCVGVVAKDAETGREYEVRARVVVNATGVWSDVVRRLDDENAIPMVSPSQGVHLVLPREFLPSHTALMVPRTDDGRVLFIIPWYGRALVGTTDTAVVDASIEPKPLEEEIHFLLEHAARYLSRDPKREDVLATFTGLRPLVRPSKEAGATKALSRDHTVAVSGSGLVTVVGGKWTTYRKMGSDTVDAAARVAELEERLSVTPELRLHGAPEGMAVSQEGVTGETLQAYGTDAPAVLALAEGRPELAEKLHPRLPYLAAEVLWATRFEMARTLEDVLARRTRALVLDARAALECAPAVAKWMAEELGRDAAWQAAELARFRTLAESALLA